MKILFAVFVATLAVLLNGCMWAPGQRMPMNPPVRSDAADNRWVRVVTITPELLAADAAEQARAVPAELLAYRTQPYRIGIGDTLYITVWDHPELTSPAGPQQATLANGRLVRSDGTLFYPYVGPLHAAGMTIEQLRELLCEKLAKYIENPQVDVNVVGYASQFVTLKGAFAKTEPLPVTAVPLTLAQAIGAAGINLPNADLSGVVLTRGGRDYTLDLDALDSGATAVPDIYLKAGDQIYLPYNDRHEIYVLGEVNRPLAINFKAADMSLTQALGKAGGLNQTTANGKAVYVIRGATNPRRTPGTVYQLDARSPAAYVLADRFMVRPGDVVFVGPTGVTRWNRFISQLLPLSSLLSNAAVSSYYADPSK